MCLMERERLNHVTILENCRIKIATTHSLRSMFKNGSNYLSGNSSQACEGKKRLSGQVSSRKVHCAQHHHSRIWEVFCCRSEWSTYPTTTTTTTTTPPNTWTHPTTKIILAPNLQEALLRQTRLHWRLFRRCHGGELRRPNLPCFGLPQLLRCGKPFEKLAGCRCLRKFGTGVLLHPSVSICFFLWLD